MSSIKNIVIADDDADDVEMFQSAIDETCPDIELSVATDGAKLIKLLEKMPTPDAIFLDLNMPNKSGKECLEEIRANDDFDDVPIVILSTSNQQDEIKFCLNNGANHYFVKPNSYSGLKNIIESICSGNLDLAVSENNNKG